MLVEQIAAWRNPFAPPERIRELQQARLVQLVRHAFRNVPFYTQRFTERGFNPHARLRVELSAIPITSKTDIKQAPFESRLAHGVAPEGAVIHETSGSTGEPMRILHTRDEAARLFGRRLRAQVLSGVRPWRRRVSLGSQPSRRWPHRLGLFRIDALPLSRTPAEMAAALTELRPHILRGPGSSLELLAEQHPDELAALRLKLLITGAEQLSARTRQTLQQTAGCPVVDFYGASECNLIAWECRRCGLYHTCDDSVIVEVLRDGAPARPGEEGEIFVTSLDSFAMPVLRYQLGDVVRLPADPPPCAIRFGVIESIEGRVVDFLWLPSGRRLSPYLLMDQLDEMQGLRRYEAEQPSPDQLVVRLQLEPGRSADDTQAEALRRCRDLIAEDVDIECRFVERFHLDPLQKRRFVRSGPSRDAYAG